ncbi:MAG: OmpP1/FadL family transporter [Gammaproteobacteria bacterium]
MRRSFSLLLTILCTAFLWLLCANTWAAGFMLFEQNAVGVGNFNAGSAALARDASTSFYNPAGLVRLSHPQVVGALTYIDSEVKFTGDVSNTLTASAFGAPTTLALGTEKGTTEGGGEFYIPALHGVLPITDDIAMGFSFVVPYGLESNYPEDSVLRYAATDTKITVYDWSPSVGFRITDKLSLGIGLDVEYMDTVFNGVGGGLVPSLDTLSKNEANGWGVGAHLGVLYQWSPNTRLGVNYQSESTFTVDGRSQFIGSLAGDTGFAENNHLSAKIVLPAHTDVGIYHAFNEHWAVMGSVVYTEWNSFNQIRLKNVMAVQSVALSPLPELTVGPTILVAHENFHNTWRAAAGVDYAFNKKFLVRMGVGYDETPTNSTDRSVRMPDGHRFATAMGLHGQPLPHVGIDIGWTHLFIKDPSIHHLNVMGPQLTHVDGKVKNDADLVAAQLTVDIA